MSKHLVLNHSGDTSRMAAGTGPDFTAQDFEGWEGRSTEASGIFMFQFRIAPSAVDFPMHASPDEWLAYVTTGKGVLKCGKENGTVVSEENYCAGDFITFGADTQHAWSSSDEETIIVFTKKA